LNGLLKGKNDDLVAPPPSPSPNVLLGFNMAPSVTGIARSRYRSEWLRAEPRSSGPGRSQPISPPPPPSIRGPAGWPRGLTPPDPPACAYSGNTPFSPRTALLNSYSGRFSPNENSSSYIILKHGFMGYSPRGAFKKPSIYILVGLFKLASLRLGIFQSKKSYYLNTQRDRL